MGGRGVFQIAVTEGHTPLSESQQIIHTVLNGQMTFSQADGASDDILLHTLSLSVSFSRSDWQYFGLQDHCMDCQLILGCFCNSDRAHRSCALCLMDAAIRFTHISIPGTFSPKVTTFFVFYFHRPHIRRPSHQVLLLSFAGSCIISLGSPDRISLLDHRQSNMLIKTSHQWKMLLKAEVFPPARCIVTSPEKLDPAWDPKISKSQSRGYRERYWWSKRSDNVSALGRSAV